MILHERLRRDCIVIGRFPLCALLLLNDANYPWFLLVPQRDAIREIHQLDAADQQQLIRESSLLAAAIEHAFRADKINIAALGNIVPQLHVPHIVRYRSDPAWPDPVWGRLPARPYAPEQAAAICTRMRALLAGQGLSAPEGSAS